MNRDEFHIKLVERYGQPKNRYMAEDLNRWFDRVNFSQYDALYNAVVENNAYESYPNVSKVKSIWDEQGFHYSQTKNEDVKSYMDLVETSKKWSVPEIVKTYKQIVKRKFRDDIYHPDIHIPLREREFICFWEQLNFLYSVFTDENEGRHFKTEGFKVDWNEIKFKIMKGEVVTLPEAKFKISLSEDRLCDKYSDPISFDDAIQMPLVSE
jgi:hypothetical protein